MHWPVMGEYPKTAASIGAMLERLVLEFEASGSSQLSPTSIAWKHVEGAMERESARGSFTILSCYLAWGSGLGSSIG